jgi:hypothetical protein
MNGPFEDPAFIAAEAWYLEQPEVKPSFWDDPGFDRAIELWELRKEEYEAREDGDEMFWEDEDKQYAEISDEEAAR